MEGSLFAQVVFVGEQPEMMRTWRENLLLDRRLGATAAQALLGKEFRVSRQRGQLMESNLAPNVMATVHPWSILRAPDEEARHIEMKSVIADLEKAAKLIHGFR